MSGQMQPVAYRQYETLLDIFYAAPTYVSKFFQRRIENMKAPFVTNAKVIHFEEVENYATYLQILRRYDKHPILQRPGGSFGSIKPDVIKGAELIEPDDTLAQQPGTNQIINGKIINSSQVEKDRKIQKIKTSYELTKEEMCKNVFLVGKLTSRETGQPWTFTSGYTGENFTTAQLTAEFETVITDIKNDYLKKNNVPIHEFLVGQKWFNLLKELYNPRSNEIMGKAYMGKVKNADGVDEIFIDILTDRFTLLPSQTLWDGTKVDTSGWLYAYHPFAFIPCYAGVVNVVNGQGMLVAAQAQLREIKIDEETGIKKILFDSAFLPVGIRPELVNIHKMTP